MFKYGQTNVHDERQSVYKKIWCHKARYKFQATWMLKMITGVQKPTEFFNHIRVTGDETLISFANVATKEQSKRWMNKRSNMPHKSTRKLLATVFWTGYIPANYDATFLKFVTDWIKQAKRLGTIFIQNKPKRCARTDIKHSAFLQNTLDVGVQTPFKVLNLYPPAPTDA
jgi:hypothetical protein